jgi:hypothetical protein
MKRRMAKNPMMNDCNPSIGICGFMPEKTNPGILIAAKESFAHRLSAQE